MCLLKFVIYLLHPLSPPQSLHSVAGLVKPPVAAEHLPQFLWDHILKDLELLAASLGRSQDDALILIHVILDHMYRTQGQGGCDLTWITGMWWVHVLPNIRNGQKNMGEFEGELNIQYLSVMIYVIKCNISLLKSLVLCNFSRKGMYNTAQH